MEEQNEIFSYTYRAREQEEIRRIRAKYAPAAQEESPLEQLRRLDGSATKGAAAVSLLVGVVSALILGVGMCCTLLPGWEAYFIPGIGIGLLGIAGMIAAYPVYTRLVKRKREKLAPEILRLTDELMK